MRKNLLVLGLGTCLSLGTANILSAKDIPATPAIQQDVEGKGLIGRWDITIQEDGKELPAWLEVKLSGTRTLVGSFVGASGSARPVSEVKFDQGKFTFSIPPQWEEGDQDFVLEGELKGNGIQGTLTTSEGKELTWKGEKAPYLDRTGKVTWGEPIDLFNGKDLSGWKALGENQWVVEDGILTSPKSGSNLISEEEFMDFKLKVEFRYQEGSNSGVYLRGRYEVQIEDSPKEAHPNNVLYSGIYGFLSPSEINSLGPNEWQTFEITLVGRMVTIVANGKTVISNQEIPGITGGALNSKEGEPGPIYIQGDHGPIEFKSIVITPAK